MKYRALRFAGRLFCRGGGGGAQPRAATLRFRLLRRGAATGGRGLCMEWAHSCAPLHWGTGGGIVSAGWARHQPAEQVALP